MRGTWWVKAACVWAGLTWGGAALAAGEGEATQASEATYESPGVNLVLGDESWFAATGTLPVDVDEQERVQTHLLWVEAKLRARPTEGLSQAQREARARNLDRLARYAAQGQFPHNDGHPDARRPTFVDEDGNLCAVGFLMSQDLGREAAERVSAREKYAFVVQITSPEVLGWQPSSGLTPEELAMIQPSYGWEEPAEPIKPITRPVDPRQGEIDEAQRRAQTRIDACFRDKDRRGSVRADSFTATVTWNEQGKVVETILELPHASRALEGCVVSALEGMRLSPAPKIFHRCVPPQYYKQHVYRCPPVYSYGPLTKTLLFRIPEGALEGPEDLSEGFRRIDSKAQRCFSQGQGAGTRLIPIDLGIRNDGRVAWARIAPQHRLLGVLRDPETYACVMRAAEDARFEDFDGGLFETSLHLSVPDQGAPPKY